MPKFGPEPLGPNSKFSSRFRVFAELEPKVQFKVQPVIERFEPELNLGLKLVDNL